MDLYTESERAAHIAHEHGFWDGSDFDDLILATKLLLIHSEVTEAMVELRAEHQDFGKLEAELADIIIRTLDVAGYLGLDLETRVARKMAENEIRPHRHGGKRF